MEKTIVVETDDNFKSCDDCVHSDDTTQICKMRGCIHALTENDIKDCYQPKEYTMTKLELRASLDSIAKLKKISKIVNTPFCEVEE